MIARLYELGGGVVLGSIPLLLHRTVQCVRSMCTSKFQSLLQLHHRESKVLFDKLTNVTVIEYAVTSV